MTNKTGRKKHYGKIFQLSPFSAASKMAAIECTRKNIPKWIDDVRYCPLRSACKVLWCEVSQSREDCPFSYGIWFWWYFYPNHCQIPPLSFSPSQWEIERWMILCDVLRKKCLADYCSWPSLWFMKCAYRPIVVLLAYCRWHPCHLQSVTKISFQDMQVMLYLI